MTFVYSLRSEATRMASAAVPELLSDAELLIEVALRSEATKAPSGARPGPGLFRRESH